MFKYDKILGLPRETDYVLVSESAQRPTSPNVSEWIFNVETGKPEWWNGSGWVTWNDHFKGYFADETALRTAYPSGVNGDYAILDSTNTVWIWDNTDWVDSGESGGVKSVNNQYPDGDGNIALTADHIPSTANYSWVSAADRVNWDGKADVSFVNDEIDGVLLWVDAEYARKVHDHVMADITDLAGTFALADHDHVMADITDLAGTFALADHDHVMADITDLAGTFAPAGGSYDDDWYCDDLYADNWIRATGTAGLYFDAYGTGLVSPLSTKLAAVGQYGTVATYGGENGYEGYSIAGRVVFMHDIDTSGWGIYNDVNNEWLIYGLLNDYTRLYHNGGMTIETTADGIKFGDATAYLRNSANETCVGLTASYVYLYYNGVWKLKTVSDGIEAAGYVRLTGDYGLYNAVDNTYLYSDDSSYWVMKMGKGIKFMTTTGGQYGRIYFNWGVYDIGELGFVDTAGNWKVRCVDNKYTFLYYGSESYACYTTSGQSFYVQGNCSAASFTDRTPYPETLDLAYDVVNSMYRLPDGEYDPDDQDFQLDHSRMHEYVTQHYETAEGEQKTARNASALISCHNEVIKDLVNKVEDLQYELSEAKNKINILSEG